MKEWKLELLGRKTWLFDEPLDMPVERFMAFMALNDDLMLGDKSFLMDTLRKQADALNSGKLGEAAQYNYALQYCIGNFTHLETFYRIASVSILLEGEDPNGYDASLNMEKVAALKAMKNDAFFLSEVLPELCKVLGIASIKDMSDFSRLEMEFKILQSTISQIAATPHT